MKYNPDKHHRRSIRLNGYDYTSSGAYFITICTYHRQCLFGAIVDGEMQLNDLGEIVRSRWLALSHYHKHVELDAFVVMPNHIHGILVLTDTAQSPNHSIPGRGAAFGRELLLPTEDKRPNATPNPPHPIPLSEPGVAFGREMASTSKNGLPNAAPLQAGSLGAIILNFKSITTRRINQMRKVAGKTVWQRNYYEHIIRSEPSLQHIRQYIYNNPLSWQQDQLYPDNSSNR